jgi:hypothetical protein
MIEMSATNATLPHVRLIITTIFVHAFLHGPIEKSPGDQPPEKLPQAIQKLEEPQTQKRSSYLIETIQQTVMIRLNHNIRYHIEEKFLVFISQNKYLPFIGKRKRNSQHRHEIPYNRLIDSN